MKKYCFSIFFITFAFCSCSLKYNNNESAEEKIPEFVFSDASFSRYENNKKTLNLSAQTLEQYKDGKSTFAKDVTFQTYDKKGEEETSGQAGYLAMDTKEGMYKLFDDISIESKKDELTVKASALKWNEKTEQLSSSKADVVTLEKDGTTIRGVGFSASGVSKKYSFEKNVSGTIHTKDNNEDSIDTSATDETETDEEVITE